MKINPDRTWDLSQPITHDGPAWPEYDPPMIAHNYRRAAEGFNAETVRLTTHMGTHVDVPFHFDDAGRTVDQMPLSAFAGPAEFLDLRSSVEPDMPIGRAQLGPLIDTLQPDDIAVLVTGWGVRRAISEEFLKHWPYLDADGAEALLTRGISAVGIDALSIGGWGSVEKGKPPHTALLSAGKIIIEDLHVPDQLIGRRCFLTAFPVLLEGCSAAWTRAVAWELE